LLTEVESVEADADDVVKVRFIKDRTRDAHLIVAGMPIFSAAWWKGRDFDAATLEAPLGSGAYKVKTFEQNRFIEFELDPNYWAKDLPLNVGGNNFQRLRYEYFRETSGRLRGLQGRRRELQRRTHCALLGYQL